METGYTGLQGQDTHNSEQTINEVVGATVISADNPILSMSDEEFAQFEQNMNSNSNSLVQTEQQVAPTETEQVNQTEPDKEETEEPQQSEPDWKTLAQPFVANGKTYQIQSPSEGIALMQKGANYEKKMHELKKHGKTIHALQSAGITSDEDLQFLIDLKSGNPAAIAKLLQDKQVDKYDIPDVEETPYTPTAQLPTDLDVAFFSVTDEIKQTPSGNTLLQTLQGWDDQSIDYFYRNPNEMLALRQEVDNGLFAATLQRIEIDRDMGRLSSEFLSMPFYQQYNTVADIIVEEHKQVQHTPQVVGTNLQQASQQQQQQTHNPVTNPVPVTAAIPRTQTVNAPVMQSFPDVSRMTDAEFAEFEKQLGLVKFG